MFLFLLITLYMVTNLSYAVLNVSHSHVHEYFEAKVKHEIPTKLFLDVAFEKLKAVFDFYGVYKSDIDLNTRIGLFIVKVNLLKSIEENPNFSGPLEELLQKNNALIDYFEEMLKQHNEFVDVLNLYTTESVWVKRIDMFGTSLTKISHPHTNDELVRVYLHWERYLRDIQNLEHHVPTPELSSQCLVALSKLPSAGDDDFSQSCGLEEACVSAVINGTDFGHALSYRLLILQTARYSRGCSILSADEDMALSSSLCVKAYNEVQYIIAKLKTTKEGLWMIDLVMNFMSHCALYGHLQFLTNKWIEAFLQHQDEFGCFSADSINIRNPYIGPPTAPKKVKPWKLLKKNQEFFYGKCNGYTTSLALGVLASVIRMIVEVDEYFVS